MFRFSSITLAALAYVQVGAANAAACFCLPGDSCWPSASDWAQLNTTVGGRLIATVPIGSPCHDPTYDAEKCAALQSAWTLPQTHLASSHSVMQPQFANQSCDPFTAQSESCLLGNYVSYTVNVTSADDVIAALNFSKSNNIRFVIRNTGHDYFGRSTGAGSLAIWTQHLKDFQVTDWADSNYTGKAVKMGAGILGYEAVTNAAANGLVVITGTCPTVGAAGGYIQGGGHSALSTHFGLAADQALEFEVVTATGSIVTASQSENSDLFWALRGGGGGTYAVVISVTVRAYPDANIGAATLQFAAASTTADKFYQAISEFHRMVPSITDSGASVAFVFTNTYFAIAPVTAYNQTSAQVKAALAPFTDVLANLSIPFAATYSDYTSYYDHYDANMGPLPYGHLPVESYNFGSRLIPRNVLENSNEELQAALRNVTENGVMAVSVALNVTAQSDRATAVHPAWRTTSIHMQMTTPWNSTAAWSKMRAAGLRMTDEFVPVVVAATPGGGTYTNEADYMISDWQTGLFGTNYAELLKVKAKYDPEGVFYGPKTVGSESYTVASDGRMCKA